MKPKRPEPTITLTRTGEPGRIQWEAESDEHAVHGRVGESAIDVLEKLFREMGDKHEAEACYREWRT